MKLPLDHSPSPQRYALDQEGAADASCLNNGRWMGAMQNSLSHRNRKLGKPHIQSVSRSNGMKIVMSLATAAMVIAYGAGAMAAELPSYEVAGFPISPVQVQLVGAARVQEQPPLATGTLDGTSASPHQISVLTPRGKRTAAAIAADVTSTGSLAR
jgi:hypothetical protein